MRLPPLESGRLVRRYKRFLADVRLDDGRELTAWCPNPGRMTGCAAPGWRVWISRSERPGRKLPHTWEVSDTPAGTGILVHTGRTNALAVQAIEAGLLPGLAGYPTLRTEVKDHAGSRVDIRLEGPGRPPCWVEVKAVTLPAEARTGAFPDAVTARGKKHLGALAARVAAGERAVQLYVLARGDLDAVRPAREIDPAYADALHAAADAGVELMALRAVVEADHVRPLGPGRVIVPGR